MKSLVYFAWVLKLAWGVTSIKKLALLIAVASIFLTAPFLWAQAENENRAETLVPRLKEIFVAEGVPAYWVWIAEVESAFNPEAESPKGARGLFQIMIGTASRFGLETNLVDERLDPEKSAHAAAKYLKVLHEQFGSWPLALAAYNAGEGYVDRLLKKHNAETFEEIAFDLPLETRNYVPKVLAVVESREGVSPDTATFPRFALALLRIFKSETVKKS